MATRPTGTVTFLFTDIEGSTRLWEEHPAEMRAALERHDEILRSVIEAHGGFVFSTTGDGLAAAFGRAGDAISAVAQSQRTLTAAQWPDAVQLRVRMGVHTGEAQERDGDYFGSAVNRAARLMAVGHGGQVLISGATAGVVATLPPDVKLVDLGVHRLRDVTEPVAVRMLVGDGLVELFPPLRVADAVPGNLPTMMTSLVGRASEIAAVNDLLGVHRLVTVVGAGGLGKTRVAVHAGAEVAWRFGDGVWFVDLLAVGPGQVAAAIAAPLSIQLPATEQGLVEAISGQRLLLVLDNCEHVLSEAARIASALVRGSEDIALLATSREPLGVAGEQLFPLRPLGGEAVTLFVERARLVSPGFEPSASELVSIAGLCDRLDGLPLAIELAAGRIRSNTVDEVVDGLRDRFQMLRAGRRSGSDRHDSMVRTLDWSYELLVPDEQLVFDRCSVFSGSFTRTAAAGICSGEDLGPPDVSEIVESLINKSLITVREHSGRSSRLDLLDTMRAYGQARLAARGTQSVIAGAHARWYAEHAYQIGTALFGAGEADRMTALVESVDNCRAAFRYLAENDRPGAERLCGGFARAGWLMMYEPCYWAVSLWTADHDTDLTDAHLWYCASMAWATMSLRRPDLLTEVRAHLDGLGADPTHPALLEVEFAVWADRVYRASEHFDVALHHDAERLRTNARINGSGYFIALAALQTAPVLGRDEALQQLDEGIRLAERDNAMAAASVLSVVRSTFIESTDPEQARDDLSRGLDMAALTNAPFVDNIATDVQLNSRLSRLDLEAKLAAADRLLVSWQRAGDIPRVFNTLATIVTLLDGRGRPGDIVFLDEAIRTHNARHHDRRVRYRQAAAAETATAHLGPADSQAEHTKAQHASLEQILLRARQAVTPVGRAPSDARERKLPHHHTDDRE